MTAFKRYRVWTWVSSVNDGTGLNEGGGGQGFSDEWTWGLLKKAWKWEINIFVTSFMGDPLCTNPKVILKHNVITSPKLFWFDFREPKWKPSLIQQCKLTRMTNSPRFFSSSIYDHTQFFLYLGIWKQCMYVLYYDFFEVFQNKLFINCDTRKVVFKYFG